MNSYVLRKLFIQWALLKLVLTQTLIFKTLILKLSDKIGKHFSFFFR